MPLPDVPSTVNSTISEQASGSVRLPVARRTSPVKTTCSSRLSDIRRTPREAWVRDLL